MLPATGIQPGSLAGDWYGWAVSGWRRLRRRRTADFASPLRRENDAEDGLSGHVHVFDSSGGQVPALVQEWSAAWIGDGAVSLRLRVAGTFAALRVTRELRDGDDLPVAAELVYAGAWPQQGPGRAAMRAPRRLWPGSRRLPRWPTASSSRTWRVTWWTSAPSPVRRRVRRPS